MAIFEKTIRHQIIEETQSAEATREFDRLHREGAQNYGMLWLICNNKVAQYRNLPYVPQNDKRIDALLSQCALKMAQTIEENRPRLGMEDLVFIEDMRKSSDEYSPYTHEEVSRLVGIIDRLLG